MCMHTYYVALKKIDNSKFYFSSMINIRMSHPDSTRTNFLLFTQSALITRKDIRPHIYSILIGSFHSGDMRQTRTPNI